MLPFKNNTFAKIPTAGSRTISCANGGRKSATFSARCCFILRQSAPQPSAKALNSACPRTQRSNSLWTARRSRTTFTV